jgi:hypothetical protein
MCLTFLSGFYRRNILFCLLNMWWDMMKIHYNHLWPIKANDWKRSVKGKIPFFVGGEQHRNFQMIFSVLNRPFKYHKHSSIKCNELSHSLCVHSCSFTRQKRDSFYAAASDNVVVGGEESLNLSTSLINMLIDDTSDFSCVSGKSCGKLLCFRENLYVFFGKPNKES